MADKKKESMMEKINQRAEKALNDTTGEYSEKEKKWAQKIQKLNADLDALKNVSPEEMEQEKKKARKNFYAYALGAIIGFIIYIILKTLNIF